MILGPRGRRAVVLAGVVLGILALVLMLLAPGAAMAHDDLADSSPGDRETVPQAPGAVLLEFTSPPAPVGAAVEVTGPDGAAGRGEPEVDGTRVRQVLSTGAPAGEYAVQWRVTSTDGHPVSGSLTFTVGGKGDAAPTDARTAPTGARPGAPEPSSPGPDAAAGVGADSAEPSAEPLDPQAAVVSEDPFGTSGVPGWVWVLSAVALLGLAGVAVAASRSR